MTNAATFREMYLYILLMIYICTQTISIYYYEAEKDRTYYFESDCFRDNRYVDITEEEFNNRMANYKQTLSEQFKESHRLEEEIMKQLDALQFNENVGSNE